METIFAQATAPGRAGVSVIRVSGPRAWVAAEILAGSVPPVREARLRVLHDADGSFIDEALVLAFDGGASFTGEPVVEFQTHGSVSVVQALLRRLGELEGLRSAEAGEFTRRAMENGRLDLSQVEALGDLIEAETEEQRKQALRLFQGALGERVAAWRERLISAAALLEAVIDFSDEEIPENVTDDVVGILSEVEGELRAQLSGFATAERIRSGFEVAIIGAPNVGKSSLMNALAGRDVALTSEVAGTTRDVIEVRLDLKGYAVTLLDTAGLRETEDPVEAMGVARARERADAADLRVLLVTDDETCGDVQADLMYRSKSDLRDGSAGSGISSKTRAGLDALLDDVVGALSKKFSSAGLATRERHRIALGLAVECLVRARELVNRGEEYYDQSAEELRSVVQALESLIGKVGVEAVLDNVFSSFCIGK